jgi:hypothetical protein
MSKQESEIYLGGGSNLIMTTSRLVTCQEILTLVINGKQSISLDVKIQADFDTIPEEYREIFLNMMTSKYCKTASFGDNPFSKCQLTPKRRWYQFWK